MAEGYHDFASAEVLTATNVDDYLMRQTVMRFASAAARDAAGLPGLEGLLAYLKDVDAVTMYTGAVWVTAYQIGAWSTYTPTCFQEDGTGQTLTVATARYTRQGRMISGNVTFTIAGAGSATNGEPIIVSMPVTPFDTASGSEMVGVGQVADISVASYPVLVVNYLGTFRFKRADATTIQHAGEDPAFALAVGDVISFNFQYEAAT